MRPLRIQQIGSDLAIKWSDGSESFLSLTRFRQGCPCAGCKGEVDVMGNLHRPPAPELSEDSFRLVSLTNVGTYAIQPAWADGHNSGIYSFDYIRHLAGRPPSE